MRVHCLYVDDRQCQFFVPPCVCVFCFTLITLLLCVCWTIVVPSWYETCVFSKVFYYFLFRKVGHKVSHGFLPRLAQYKLMNTTILAPFNLLILALNTTIWWSNRENMSYVAWYSFWIKQRKSRGLTIVWIKTFFAVLLKVKWPSLEIRHSK